MNVAINTQTLMRLSVSRCIETALGFNHLHQDPTKLPKDDFMSYKTLTIIEEATKMRKDLTWAMEARKTVTGDRGSFLGNRLRKSPIGGQRNPTAQSNRGQRRGAGVKPPGGKRSRGTKRKQIEPLTWTTMTTKGGRAPLTGLGYLFDATLRYPGKGSSHHPPTRRGVRPSLRFWSTRRPNTTA
jgi:hypothetical protein